MGTGSGGRLSLNAIVAMVVAGLGMSACGPDEVPANRLPRFEPPAGPAPRVALVLGSGGPRGFAHIGVLKVLEENGIRPDLIVGSSVGAMVGVLSAGGYDAPTLERFARELNVMDFFLEWRLLGGGPASGAAVQHYVNEKLGGRTIEQLAVPFVAVAARAEDRKLALFNRGDPGLAVRASGASPGQFAPVAIRGEPFVDGDEASPVPVKVARSLGARFVIAVDVSAHLADTPPGAPPEWVRKDERRARQIAAEVPQADVLLHPNIGYYAGHDEKYRARVMAIAERYTREAMPGIREALAKAGLAPAQKSPTASMPAALAAR